MTDRFPDETAEEREARLQSDRVLVRHRQQQVMQAQLPLFLSELHFMHTTYGYAGRTEMYMRFPGLKIHSHVVHSIGGCELTYQCCVY